MALKPGFHLGPYEIVSPIGTGGMGEVYKAKDARLDRMVAIKVLPEELAKNRDSLARFEREAKAVAALNHPNITGIFDIGHVEETAYAVMELLEGESLRGRLLQGSLTPRLAIELAVQMAHGLAAAHDKGVIHRDLKPDNLWITTEGRLKILDFGLAKQVVVAGRGSQSYLATQAVSAGHALHTEEGMILGTLGYMSPEQVRGESVDARSDIFSFGVVLFEMLVGKRAFARDNASDTMAAILRDDPPAVSLAGGHIPPALRRIIDHCLEKIPARRFHDANDLAFALENLASTSDSDASFMAPFAPQHRETTWRWAALAFALGSAVVFGVWTWARLHPSEKPRVTRLSIHLPAGQVLTGIGGPAVSRDGRSIAYAARDAAGVSRLYVRVLDRFEPSLIPESEGASEPFFSPDGNRIGFFARGKLMTASCSGGAAAPIANASFFNFGATWGEDDTIVFVPSLTAGLVRIPSSGGKPQQLTEPDDAAKGYAHVWPQFLPGGRSVFFTIWGGVNFETVGTAILPLNSGNPITGLVPGQGSSAYARSGHVLKSGGRRGLMAASFNPDHPQTTPVQTFVLDDVFSQPAASCSWFSVSDSGTLVYVPGDRYMSTVAWVDREGRVTPQAEKAASVGDPALSPDGTKVVLVQDEALWLVDVRRGTRSRLTQETERTDAYPVFSRDGTRIFFGSNRGGDWDIYSVPVGGGPVKTVLARTGNQFPLSEAPDGTLLFSERRKGTAADLWTLSHDGKVSPFIVSLASKVGGQYAPDGRTVAYVSDETGRDEIHIRSVVRPDDDTVVSVDGGREPMWSPDGKELFYRRGDAFMAASVSTSGPLQVGSARKLFEIQAAIGRSTMHAGYGVSPDGKRFMVLLLDPRAIPTQINVVLNWFEELNAKVPPR